MGTERFRGALLSILVITSLIAPIISHLSLSLAFTEPGQSPPLRGGKLVIAQSTDADILDPHRTVYDPSARVIGLIFDSLMTFDWDMSYRPLLAESWEIDPSGLSITFHLRHGVKFHCGHPFNAEAVRYTINRIKTLPGSKHTESVRKITEVEVVDNYTVRIHLSDEDRYVFGWFATNFSAIVCPDCAVELGRDYGVTSVCGTGPFKFKQWIPDNRIILERNEEYTWGPSTYQNRGPAHLSEITFKVIPEDLAREVELENGEANFLVSVPQRAELIQRWREDPNINMVVQSRSSMIYVGFNCSTPGLPLPPTAENSPVNDVRVRRAILHAVYKENIIEYACENLASPAYGPLTTIMWGYLPEIENMYPYDLDEARRLLKEAGYSGGVKIDLLAMNQDRRVAEALYYQLREVGIDLDYEIVPFGSLDEMVRKCQYDMFIMGYTWHAPDMIWWLFHTSQLPSPNRFWWGNENTDAVIENTFSLDDNVALEALYESQRLIMEDAVLMPVVERMNFMAYRAEVKGFRMHPLGGQCWKHLDTYVLPTIIPATINIAPDTLNLRSRGQWITCYIELPEGYDVADIDIGSIRLNRVVPAEPKPTGIGGRKLMVKFSRSAVQAIVDIGEVELTVTGSVNGMPFEGNDTIRVIKPGKADLELRFADIPMDWSLAQPAERVELEMEFMEIPLYWALAPD